eukprot:g71874.t1
MPRKAVRDRRKQAMERSRDPEAPDPRLQRRLQQAALELAIRNSVREKQYGLLKAISLVLPAILGLYIYSRHGISHAFFVSSVCALLTYPVVLACHIVHNIFGRDAPWSTVRNLSGALSFIMFVTVWAFYEHKRQIAAQKGR